MSNSTNTTIAMVASYAGLMLIFTLAMGHLFDNYDKAVEASTLQEAQDEEQPRFPPKGTQEVPECLPGSDHIRTSCVFDEQFDACMAKALLPIHMWPRAGNTRVDVTIVVHCKFGLGEQCGKHELDHAHIYACFIE